MALVNRTFDQLIDFTRTSAGTFFGSNGLLQTTPASANLLTYTQEFDNAAWTKTDTTVTANSTTAPDGTATADTLTEGSAGTAILSGTGAVSAAGATATFSIYLKRGNTDWVRVGVLNGANGFRAWFNLNTGAAGSTGAVGTGTVTGASIVNAGNGWYRCIVTGAIPSVTAYLVFTHTASADNSGTRVSGGTYLAWGAQLETGSVATTYTRNFGGVYPPRFDYNPVSLQPLGLLIEEQRTNLLTYSEQFNNVIWTNTNLTVVADNAVAPTGATTADTLDDGTTNGIHRTFRSNITFTAATQTLSVFAKAGTASWFQLLAYDGVTPFYANFNVSSGATGNKSASTASTITPVGNGWYRCSMIMTTAATTVGNLQVGMLDADAAQTTPVFTGANRTLLVWGIQHEVGAFPTSYIQTVASQVTRTSDNPLVQAPNFASWYNQTQGTFYVEFTPDTNVTANTIRVLSVSQPAAAARVVDIHTGVSNWQSYNGTTNVVAGTATVTSTPQKIAAAFASGSYAICLNGGTVGTASSSLVNSPTQMTIGYLSTAAQYMNGHMRAIRFYPARLTDAQLQALTA